MSTSNKPVTTLARRDCYFCDGEVRRAAAATTTEIAPISAPSTFCVDAECVVCGAKYVAWLRASALDGLTILDLSFRSTLSVVPGDADRPTNADAAAAGYPARRQVWDAFMRGHETAVRPNGPDGRVLSFAASDGKLTYWSELLPAVLPPFRGVARPPPAGAASYTPTAPPILSKHEGDAFKLAYTGVCIAAGFFLGALIFC